jgi:hypothetical protein
MDALRGSVWSLIMQSVNYLSRFPIPVRQIMFPDFGHEGPMTGGTSRNVLDARWVTMPMLRVWDGWPQLQALISVIKSDPTLSAVILADQSGNRSTDEAWAVASTMSQFLLDYVETISLPATVWRQEAFDKLFDVFAESIRLGGYRLTLWTAIHNCHLSGTMAPIPLFPGISLDEPDERTRETLLPTFTLENISPDAPRYYIRAEERVPFHRFPSHETQQASGRIVVGVRLAVGGNAYIRRTRAITEPGSCVTYGAFGSYTIAHQPFSGAFHIDNPSLIAATDIEAVKQFTLAVPKLNEEFPIALSRFTSTTDRQNPTDRLIDATIGLENLLLQGISDELSFRLALRGAWLLGDTQSTRQVEFAQLKKAYDARSRVVHGIVPATPEMEMVAAAIDGLRRLLRTIAASNLKASELKARLDNVVFGD